MYGQIQETGGYASEIALRAFKWVMCSYQPISPATLVDAVCQDPFTDVMDDVDDVNVDVILQACQNLISLDSSGKVCKFSHLSVQEYLENNHFGHGEAHELLATVCFKRLNCLEVSGPRSLPKLYEYAATHWNFHLQRTYETRPGDPRLLSLLQRFLGSRDGTSNNYKLWLQSRRLRSKRLVPDEVANQFAIASFDGFRRMSDFLSPTNHVSLALALFGLDHILPDLWRSIDPFDCSTFGESLVVLAAMGGHASTVEALIQAGSDVNSFGSWKGALSALYAAVDSGSIPTTKALLAAGANVNFCAPYRRQGQSSDSGQFYGNALHLAIHRGNLPMVDLLLEEGAQPNASGIAYDNALQAACQHGSQNLDFIIPKLLNAGADVNLGSGRWGTALQAASLNNLNDHIVRLLLDAGADVNKKGSDYGCALRAACASGGNEPIIKLLLDAGADVNMKGGKYDCALCAVCQSGGNEPIIKLLLDAGADVNIKCGEYGCGYGYALQAASIVPENEATIKMLLSAGANVNAEGGWYGYALQAASRTGGEACVKILLSADADVNATGGRYGCALQAASRIGGEACVKVLLSAGADVNAAGGYYGRALQAASRKPGNKAIVKVLLSAGADVNAQGGKYGNALQAALEWGGNEAVVKLLLSAGADVNAQNGKYGNALQATIVRRDINLVKIVLKEGADVNKQGSPVGNALFSAVLQGNRELVSLLLDVEANSEQSEMWCQPVSAAFMTGAFDIVLSLLTVGCGTNTLEADIERFLEWRSYGLSHEGFPLEVRKIFDNPPRGGEEILKSTHRWLEDEANGRLSQDISGPEDTRLRMQAYMERGRVHLKGLMEAGEWQEEDFDESEFFDRVSYSDCSSDSDWE